MSIGIVTAFYDIGRADWNTRPGAPDWLSRSVNSYFDCFERLCRVDNELIVFTEEKFQERIYSLREKYGLRGKTRVFCRNIFSDHKDELYKIDQVMKRPEFLEGVVMPYCPEYWEPRYVLVNYLKSFLAFEAIENGYNTSKKGNATLLTSSGVS